MDNFRRPRGASGRAAAVVGLALSLAVSSLLAGGPITRAASTGDEVRALWVLRTSLSTPGAIAAMVASAKASGFNTLLVQVRGRGDAYYSSTLEPRAASLAAERESFDPLAMTLARAHDAGLRVHAWINLNLVSSATDLPASRDHLIYRHPEWLMVPRALADEMWGMSPQSPEYVGKLARWARSQPAEVEGLYMSPIPLGAADHLVRLVSDLLSRYPVDGIHLDYARYPNDEFDYSAAALAAFRADVASHLTDADRQSYDERSAIDRTMYTEAFPARWREFRQSRLTSLVMRIRTAVKTRRASALLSVAVYPDAVEAATHRLQDWRTWIESGLIDVLCPMVYTPDAGAFRSQVDTVRQLSGFRPVWAGIGAYRLSSAQIVENILVARRLGANGIILFSYDSLTDPGNGADYLAQIARAAFNQ